MKEQNNSNGRGSDVFSGFQRGIETTSRFCGNPSSTGEWGDPSDWRQGCLIYQVMVDRFVPPFGGKPDKSLYHESATIREWSDKPMMGHYLDQWNVWSHEVDFWGGNLQGVLSRLDHIQDLGADVLYLNPIFHSLTNHKYDTWDYFRIDPAYGTETDLKKLAIGVHDRKMHLILDGVFNHMGSMSPLYQKALANPKGPTAGMFRRNNEGGFIPWAGAQNLPELDLNSSAVAEMIYKGRDSVVRHYIREFGVDGWRLDVAYEMGIPFLSGLRKAAREELAKSLLVGEIWNFPGGWQGCLDGILAMHGRQIILSLLDGTLNGATAGAMWERGVLSTGIDFALKSWLVLENHDTPRLTDLVRSRSARKVARMLQFTLPGSPCLYYGCEIPLLGGHDPDQRAPMDWNAVEKAEKDPASELNLIKRLSRIREEWPSLKWGGFRLVHTSDPSLFCFMRTAPGVREEVLVVVNATGKARKAMVQVPEGRIHDMTPMECQITGWSGRTHCGFLEVNLPARSAMILVPDAGDGRDYTKYKHTF
ncbi:MAG: hypothetical protein CVV64_12690 [Candidatus Wallbacteria bacterium HGW-Wallbacteria-1]|jgi:glycosidase|uniref:Glycosyl hydrolase family 13 catalytic domain-containing protein n=1 Tax=Candidatus Wallbacteria bacterium HGW-Wallbacteria-1 TaxID=2013854 RepID=A0A2N1PN72_9BACT|nr:MAG: hypothetical protein CVV64_12690 [Candidatus Wallbacteria bacterium HGW-Wallbacteria-1]